MKLLIFFSKFIQNFNEKLQIFYQFHDRICNFQQPQANLYPAISTRREKKSFLFGLKRTKMKNVEHKKRIAGKVIKVQWTWIFIFCFSFLGIAENMMRFNDAIVFVVSTRKCWLWSAQTRHSFFASRLLSIVNVHVGAIWHMVGACFDVSNGKTDSFCTLHEFAKLAEFLMTHKVN